ncbi:MAG: hypothetical protein ACM3L9_03915 [Deltaproteobacteria bacterium]
MLAPGLFLAHEWRSGFFASDRITEEWGPIELIQQVLTGIAAVLFFQSWRRGTGPVQVAGGALALLAAAAFVREIEVKRIAFAIDWDWLVWLARRGLQEILLVAMTFPIFVYLYVNRSQFMNLVKLAFRWQAWPLYLSGFLMLASVYLDGRTINGISVVFWEELIEIYAFVFMAFAAWRHLRLVDDPAWSTATLPT